MGKKNNVMCSFLEDGERFADFVNGSLYGGNNVVLPEQIIDCQTVYSESGKSRDLLKAVCKGGSYMLIGVENQDQIHYAMPVRCMEYDVQEYKKQLRRLKAKYRKAQGEGKYMMSGAEFLSGMKKGDKLQPVMTIVFYHGKDPYDGCRSLHDMLDLTKENGILNQYIANYHINLVILNELDEDNFKTGLRELIGFMKRSCNKKEFEKFCHENELRMREMDEETFDAISILIDRADFIKKKGIYAEKGGKINMCKAMDDWAAELRMEGLAQGISQGLNQGISRGIEAFVLDHLEDGTEEVRIIDKLQKRFQLDEKTAYEVFHMYSL